VSLVKFHARNHRQQVGRRGADPLVDDRATTPETFAPLHERFGFSIDVAASPHNAKLDRYFTFEQNGLEQSWAGERVWCNPPYSDIGPWIRKAWAEVDAQVIVMLLPANRTEQVWWQEHVEPYRDRPGTVLRTEFLRGRLRFIAAGRTEVGPNERPPFGCVLLIWEHWRHRQVPWDRSKPEQLTLGEAA
jgi:phage N-6-adenine-methyltransferase